MAHECCGGKPTASTTTPTTTDECNGHHATASGECCRTAGALTELTTDQVYEVPTDKLILRYRRGIECVDRRVMSLSESQLDTAFLPDAGVGLWPVRVLLGHCADADLAAIHRMRRAVAEDNPVFSEWDENAFVDANMYGNADKEYAGDPEADRARVMNALGGYLAVIHTLRQWTAAWLFGLSEEQLGRTGLHPTRGQLSVRRIVAMYVWHMEHHARFLNRKLDLMLGAGAPVASTGGCGCH